VPKRITTAFRKMRTEPVFNGNIGTKMHEVFSDPNRARGGEILIDPNDIILGYSTPKPPGKEWGQTWLTLKSRPIIKTMRSKAPKPRVIRRDSTDSIGSINTLHEVIQDGNDYKVQRKENAPQEKLSNQEPSWKVITKDVAKGLRKLRKNHLRLNTSGGSKNLLERITADLANPQRPSNGESIKVEDLVETYEQPNKKSKGLSQWLKISRSLRLPR
jgi:hypothetical protein